MTDDNELKAIALIIGRQLEKRDWYDYSAEQAHTYCADKARSMGITDETEIEKIALMAMHFVVG